MNATFSPLAWARKFRAAHEDLAANACTVSGYSRRLADDCQREIVRLYAELFAQLAGTPVYTDDLFNRPQLAAVLTAVHAAQREGGGSC